MPSSRESSWRKDQTHISCFLRWKVDSLPLKPVQKHNALLAMLIVLNAIKLEINYKKIVP